jgi:hypothetical protein
LPDFYIKKFSLWPKIWKNDYRILNILHIDKFMARFWLNLGWDDCHFVHLLLFGQITTLVGAAKRKFLKKRLISHSLHASCNNYNVRAVCTWVPTLTYCIFSSLAAKLQLTRYFCQFFLMLQQLLHAMQ